MVSHNPSTITSYEVPTLPSMQQGLCQLKQRELFPLISLFTTDVWAQFPPPTRDKVRGDVNQSPGAALPSHSVPGRHGCCYRPSLCVCSRSRGSLFVASNGTTLFVITFVYKREFCVLLPSRGVPNFGLDMDLYSKPRHLQPLTYTTLNSHWTTHQDNLTHPMQQQQDISFRHYFTRMYTFF